VTPHPSQIALLTGGADQPYALGLTKALLAQGLTLDVIAGDELDNEEFRNTPSLRFLNLRGNQDPKAGFLSKALRVLAYYWRLIGYALFAKPPIFHILWNNKFEAFDRTLLTLYYKALGKKVILTVHNVNAAKRDGGDTPLNRFTLRFQYQHADHIFVHTDKMKSELVAEFAVRESAVTVIPFGINNAAPHTSLTPAQARQKLGIGPAEKVILFFGNIAPYKGLEYLVDAFREVSPRHADYRLLIIGTPKLGSETYWTELRNKVSAIDPARTLQRLEFVPDADTEIYFKASDVLVLPYTEIFQSGVLVLGYSFGLPAIVADVGSLREDVVEGRTGLVFKPRDSVDLGRALEQYFTSDLFAELPHRRVEISDYARQRYSWDTVGDMTQVVYADLLGSRFGAQLHTS
jgi:glycosyltransferase involved in cell wall biosynthesis